MFLFCMELKCQIQNIHGSESALSDSHMLKCNPHLDLFYVVNLIKKEATLENL